MKQLSYLLVLCISLMGAASCSPDNDPQDCVTGPVGFNVEFIDSETGENLYRTNRFQPSQLQVTDEDNKMVPHQFITELEKTFIQINLEFAVGEKTISMKLDEETTVDFELTVSSQQGNCVAYFISEFDVPEYLYDDSSTSGIIRVFL